MKLTLGLLLCALSISSAPAAEAIREHKDARHGQVLFLENTSVTNAPERGTPGRPAFAAPGGQDVRAPGRPAHLTAAEAAPHAETALGFLERHGRGLGEADPRRNLRFQHAQRDALGMSHVRFQQHYRGLPVFGTEITVHLTADGQVSSAGGRAVPDLAVDPAPVLTREQAVANATVHWLAQYRAQFPWLVQPVTKRAELCVLAPGLLKNSGEKEAYLVWPVELADVDADPRLSDTYFIDAHSRDLRFHLDHVMHI